MSNESSNTGLSLEQLCVDCADPAGLSSWWQSLIGGERTTDDDGDVHLDGGLFSLLFIEVPEPKAVKNRLHLDLRADNFDQAVDHALAIGATAADDIHVSERWRVLRDPEGNEFCILRPRPGTARI
jgi:hypothetical protein